MLLFSSAFCCHFQGVTSSFHAEARPGDKSHLVLEKLLERRETVWCVSPQEFHRLFSCRGYGGGWSLNPGLSETRRPLLLQRACQASLSCPPRFTEPHPCKSNAEWGWLWAPAILLTIVLVKYQFPHPPTLAFFASCYDHFSHFHLYTSVHWKITGL